MLSALFDTPRFAEQFKQFHINIRYIIMKFLVKHSKSIHCFHPCIFHSNLVFSELVI